MPEDDVIIVETEKTAIIKSLLYTLEHSTSDYFPPGMRKAMAEVLARLER